MGSLQSLQNRIRVAAFRAFQNKLNLNKDLPPQRRIYLMAEQEQNQTGCLNRLKEPAKKQGKKTIRALTGSHYQQLLMRQKQIRREKICRLIPDRNKDLNLSLVQSE